MNKLKVDIIEEVVANEENTSTKSSPNWLLDRATEYVKNEGLIDTDELWFVLDTDKWGDEQIRNLIDHGDNYPNWNVAISNPCFEVWLYYHKTKEIEKSEYESCQQFKHEISNLEKGGYNKLKYIPLIHDANKNSKEKDANKEHAIPNVKETKLYLLRETLLAKIGINDFDTFIKTKLPQLIEDEKKKAAAKKNK